MTAGERKGSLGVNKVKTRAVKMLGTLVWGSSEGANRNEARRVVYGAKGTARTKPAVK